MILSRRNIHKIKCAVTLLLCLSIGQNMEAQSNLVNNGASNKLHVTGTTNLKVFGSVINNAGASVNNESSIYITGDLDNQATFFNDYVSSGKSEVVFESGQQQDIKLGQDVAFSSAVFNNTSAQTNDDITINNNIVIEDWGIFKQGILAPQSGTVTFDFHGQSTDNTTYPSSFSYVEGPVYKNLQCSSKGCSSPNGFTFPIGKQVSGINHYKPLKIKHSGGTFGLINSTSSAEYINGQSPNHPSNGASANASIAQVNSCEYWDLGIGAGGLLSPFQYQIGLDINAGPCANSYAQPIIVGYSASTNTWINFGGVVVNTPDGRQMVEMINPIGPDGVGITSDITQVTIGEQAVLCNTVVSNTNDSGPGSLRDAINCANTTPGVQTITFDFPNFCAFRGAQPPPPVITLTSPLPTIIEAVNILGVAPSTGFGGRSNGIDIDGSALSGGSGLRFAFTVNPNSGAVSEIAGLNIYNFPYYGFDVRSDYVNLSFCNAANNTNAQVIYLDCDQGEVEYCQIGLTSFFTVAFPVDCPFYNENFLPSTNSAHGLLISGATNINATGNVVAGNPKDGIRLVRSTSNVELNGNRIGFTLTSSGFRVSPPAIYSNQDGIEITNGCTNVNVDENIIGGNTGRGVYAHNNTSTTITNNWIGGWLQFSVFPSGGNFRSMPNQKQGIIIADGINASVSPYNKLIEGNTIVENGLQGILLNYSENVKIVGNYVGVYFDNLNVSTIGNQIKSAGNGNQGINTNTCSNIEIGEFDNGNYIGDNANNGIYLLRGDNFSVKYNIIGNNGSPVTIGGSGTLPNGVHGLYTKDINGSVQNEVLNNVIAGNSKVGIRMLNCSNWLVDNNRIGVDEDPAQIVAATGLPALVPKPNGTYGVYVSTGHDLTFSNNIVSENLNIGMYLTQIEDVLVNNSRVTNNAYGINVSNGAAAFNATQDVVIRDNDLSFNGGYGIYTNKSRFTAASLIIRNNEVNDNGKQGLNTFQSEGVIVDENRFLRNGLYGVLEQKSSHFEFTKNTINQNVRQGMYLFGSSDNMISDNYIGTDELLAPGLGNGEYGILIKQYSTTDGAVRNQVIDNHIYYNGFDGIRITEPNAQPVDFNYVQCNSFLGIGANYQAIALADANPGTNEGVVPPVITFADGTTGDVAGTALPGEIIQIYKIATGGNDQEAEECITAANSIVTDGSGNWTTTLGTGIFSNSPGDRLVATATTSSTPVGSTSELSAAITAAPCPIPTIVFAGTDPTQNQFCETDLVGSPLTFSSGNNANVDTYEWRLLQGGNDVSPSVTLTGTSTSVPDFVIAPGAGTYTVRLTLSNSSGCVRIDNRVITIWGEVIAAYSMPSDICSGETVDFDNTSTGPIQNYNWTADGGIFGTITTFTGQDPQNISFATITRDINQNITLEVSNGGCSSSVDHDLKVHPLPVVTIASTEGTGCNNPNSSDGEVYFTLRDHHPLDWLLDGVTPALGTNLTPIFPSLVVNQEITEFDGTALRAGSHTITTNSVFTATDGAAMSCSSTKPFTIPYEGIVLTSCAKFARCTATEELTDVENYGTIEFSVNAGGRFVTEGGFYTYKVTDLSGGDVYDALGNLLQQNTNVAGGVPLDATADSYSFNYIPGGTYLITVEHYRYMDLDNNPITPSVLTNYCSHTNTLRIKLPTLALGVPNKNYFCMGTTAEVTLTPSIQTTTSGCQPYYPTNSFTVTLTSSNGFNETYTGDYDVQTSSFTNGDFPQVLDLEEGTYDYAITESVYGCSYFGNFKVIGQPLTLTVSTEDEKCYDDPNDGSAIANLSGYSGTQATYNWYDAGGSQIPNESLSEIYELDGRGNVDYEVEVVTAEGCTTALVPFTIHEPTDLQITHATTTEGECIIFGNSGAVFGGTAGYYVYAVKIENADGNSVGPLTAGSAAAAGDGSYTIDHLTPGLYEVYAVDANGCRADYTGTVQVIAPDRDLREYNVCLTWFTIPEEEEEPPTPPVITVTVGEIAQSIQDQVLKCEENAQYAAESIVEEACYDVNSFSDKLTLEYPLNYNHYTLYYYDRAGDLVSTIPPAGVEAMLEVHETNGQEIGSVLTSIDPAPSNDYLYPKYNKYLLDNYPVTGESYAFPYEYENVATGDVGYKTYYTYNTLGQLTHQRTPDGAKTDFLYNDLGQLRFSQNAEQVLVNSNKDEEYSYTKYDNLGRIYEVGQAHESDFSDIENSNLAALNSGQDMPSDVASTSEETRTTYTTPASVDYFGQPQRHLRNRISQTFSNNLNGSVSTTYYSYDPHGNVEWLVQDVPGLGRNYIAYDYDLISGNVKQVRYNEGLPDQYFHKYVYDEDNRITDMLTSKDGICWENDAHYEYMPHGPLARVTLGEHNLQGMDYAYTIHGWLKGINSVQTKLLDDNSIITDVNYGNLNSSEETAADVFGMSLRYFNGDFGNSNVASFNSELTAASGREMFNGNISTWSSVIADPVSPTTENGRRKSAYQYTYDRLNRLKNAKYNYYRQLPTSFVPTFNPSTDYGVALTYDRNGNIETLDRTAFTDKTGLISDGIIHGNNMDHFTYHYPTESNQLDWVSDVAYSATNSMGDNDPALNWDDIKATQAAGNYSYDAIGNLVTDVDEDKEITWNVYGKVAEVGPIGGGASIANRRLVFTYDASGNRIRKDVFNGIPAERVTSYYVRDASGNVMAIYERKAQSVGPTANGTYTSSIRQTEVPLYGSDRVGIYRPDNVVVATNSGGPIKPLIDLDDVPMDRIEDVAIHNAHYYNWVYAIEGPTTGTPDELILAKAGDITSAGRPTPMSITGFNFNTISNDAIGLAEDLGEVRFVFARVSGGTNGTTLLVLNPNGAAITMSNGTIPTVSILDESKPVAFKRPGYNGSQYCLVYKTTTGSYEYMTIEVGKFASATILSAGNNLADLADAGNYLGVIEDEIKDEVTLFYTISNGSFTTASLEQLTWTSKGIETNTLDAGLGAYTAQGEFDIKPDGKELAVAMTSSTGKIHLLTYEFVSEVTTDNGVNTNANGKISLSYSSNGDDLVYTSGKAWGHLNAPGSGCKINAPYAKGDVACSGTDIYGFGTRTVGGPGGGTTFNSLFACGNVGGSTLVYAPRFGMLHQNHKITTIRTEELVVNCTTDLKDYEMKDHLGNVRVVISDKPGLLASAKVANVRSYNNYYPFGMIMPNRSKDSPDYRYGFNGMEKDDEVKGSGNSYTTHFRQYDSRLGRWHSVDPVTHSYMSPYVAFDNDPINIIDPRGADGERPYAVSYRNYRFIFDLNSPQKVVILRMNDNMVAERIELNMGLNDGGLNVLLSDHSEAIVNESDRDERGRKFMNDEKRMTQKMLNQRFSNGRKATRLLGKFLDSQDEIKMAVVGNFGMTGSRRFVNDDEWYNGKKLHRTRSSAYPMREGYIRINRNSGQIRYNVEPDGQREFTLDRAKFINRKFFGNSQNVTPYSRLDLPNNLNQDNYFKDLGHDPIGIQIKFDLSGVPDSKLPKRPKFEMRNDVWW